MAQKRLKLLVKRGGARRNRELLKKAIAFLNSDALVPGKIIYQNLGLTKEECEEFRVNLDEDFVES